jgi:hypothetical protein
MTMRILDDDEYAAAEAAEPPENEEELASLCREHFAEALKGLAQIASDGRDPDARKAARRVLDAALLRLKATLDDPATPPAVRFELERERRKLLVS